VNTTQDKRFHQSFIELFYWEMSGLTAEPNSKKRSSRWAFNLTGKYTDLVKTSPRAGIEKQ